METEQKPSGAILGLIIIMIILVFGGFYIWKNSMKERVKLETLKQEMELESKKNLLELEQDSLSPLEESNTMEGSESNSKELENSLNNLE